MWWEKVIYILIMLSLLSLYTTAMILANVSVNNHKLVTRLVLFTISLVLPITFVSYVWVIGYIDFFNK